MVSTKTAGWFRNKTEKSDPESAEMVQAMDAKVVGMNTMLHSMDNTPKNVEASAPTESLAAEADNTHSASAADISNVTTRWQCNNTVAM